jgi:Domain of unknown function (DUF5615)
VCGSSPTWAWTSASWSGCVPPGTTRCIFVTRLHRLPDPQIFNKAIAEQRIVLTFDLDYRRLVKRRGDKKAIVAVAHSILVIAYHVLRDGQSYRELGSDYFDHLNAERLTRYPHQAARGTRLRRHPHEGA